MKVLVGVPFHASNTEHVDFFLNQLKKEITRTDSNQIDWEIDANGCPTDISEYLVSEVERLKTAYDKMLNKSINMNVTVHDEGGRFKALNRIAFKAIDSGYEAVIYRNDDIIMSEGGLGKLIDGLVNNRMLSASCLPYNMIEDANYEVSLVQQAEINRYHKVKNTPFRGDLFAVRSDILLQLTDQNHQNGIDGPFIAGHSDDLFLDYWHQEQFKGEKLGASSTVFAYHFPENNWENAAHRITRHFEGTNNLVEQERWKKYNTATKGLEKNIANFLSSFEAANNIAQEIGLVSNIRVEKNKEVKGLAEVWTNHLEHLKKHHAELYKTLPHSYNVEQVIATLSEQSDNRGIINPEYKEITYNLVSDTLRLLAASKSEEKTIVNESNWIREACIPLASATKVIAKKSKPKKVAFWVESRHGAGHMNVVAQTSQELEILGFETLIITTTDKMARDFNLREDQLVILPGYMTENGPDSDKTINGINSLEDTEWHKQRAEIMLSSLLKFKPDFFITEAWPLAKGPLYDHEGEYTVTKLRDIFGDNIQIAAISSDINLYTRAPIRLPYGGSEESAAEFMQKYYNRVFVRGDETFLSLDKTFNSTERIKNIIEYSGYFIQSKLFNKEQKKEDLIVISSGMGFKETEDPDFFIKALEALKIERPQNARVVCFVSNEFTKSEKYSEFRELASQSGVEVLETSPRYRDFMMKAKLLICRGSYNNTIEANLSKTPTIVIPRLSSKEQMTRAKIYNENGFVLSLSPDQPQEEFTKEISETYGAKVKPMNVKMDGAKRLAQHIEQHIGEKKLVSYRV